ncbi:RNA polymerase, partial [Trichodelitschia bisporula]
SDSHLYEDNFTLTGCNDQKYDRVARYTAISADNSTSVSLDVNTDLYPLSVDDNVQLLLASTLNLDGSKDDKGWRDRPGEQTLADLYDYVCYGKVYRFEEGAEGEIIKVYVSFGGLLLFIEGPYKKLTPLRVDNVYLLLKK